MLLGTYYAQNYASIIGGSLATIRHEELQKQLVFGDHLSPQERQHLEELLLSHNEVFALTDYKIEETDLLTHSIDTGDSAPVNALPHRLPYVLQRELEAEMQKLMDLGCIEPSNGPYVSPLVLVRKKEGGLRVCVDYHNVNKD